MARGRGVENMEIAVAVTQLITAGLILLIWSSLYRHTIWFKIGEHIAIGCLFGYILNVQLRALWTRTFIPAFAGDVNMILVMFVGAMIWLRLVPSLAWLSRIPIAILTGISMSIGIKGSIYPQIVKQAIIKSWNVPGDAFASFNNILTGVFAFTTIIYFIYTRENKGVQGALTRVGRIGLMFLFGTVIGTQLMSNTAFAIGLIPSLTSGYGVYVVGVAIVLIIIDIYRRRSQTTSDIIEP